MNGESATPFLYFSEVKAADAMLDPGPTFVDVDCDGGLWNMLIRDLPKVPPAVAGVVRDFDTGVGVFS